MTPSLSCVDAFRTELDARLAHFTERTEAIRSRLTYLQPVFDLLAEVPVDPGRTLHATLRGHAHSTRTIVSLAFAFYDATGRLVSPAMVSLHAWVDEPDEHLGWDWRSRPDTRFGYTVAGTESGIAPLTGAFPLVAMRVFLRRVAEHYPRIRSVG